jgi:hypothetical protein
MNWLCVIMQWRIENTKKFQKNILVMIVAINTNIVNSLTKEKNKTLSFELIYNLFFIELEVFKKYLVNFLIKEFIVSLFSSTKISILFLKKSKNDLRLYVNYKKLNAIMIKNCQNDDSETIKKKKNTFSKT